MNDKSKRKRQKRVREQKILQRTAHVQEQKEKHEREKLEYQTRPRKEPFIRANTPDPAILEENIKILEEAMAEYKGQVQFKVEGNNELDA